MRLLPLFAVLAACFCLGVGEASCPLIVQQALVGGVGVFAGREFKRGEMLESSIAIEIQKNATTLRGSYLSPKHPVLDRYVFQLNDTWCLVVLGNAMLFNHGRHSPIKSFVSQAPMGTGRGSTLYKMSIQTMEDIAPNTEIFDNYGSAYWFGDRNEWFFDYEGGSTVMCDTHTCFAQHFPCTADFAQFVPAEGEDDEGVGPGRMVATRDLAVGDTIEIARALLVLESAVEGAAIAPFAWRREYPMTERLTLAVLLLGTGSLYRASDDANLHYTWWSEERQEPQSRLVIDDCRDTMFVIFRVSRAVKAGEELTVKLRVNEEDGLRYATGAFTDVCL